MKFSLGCAAAYPSGVLGWALVFCLDASLRASASLERAESIANQSVLFRALSINDEEKNNAQYTQHEINQFIHESIDQWRLPSALPVAALSSAAGAEIYTDLVPFK